MRSPDQLVTAFRASGRKVTPQRERIFHVLHHNTGHPTADAVHAEVVADMPSVSLKTVYSTLHELAEMGELRQLDLGTGSARFDPNTGDHHHLVCEGCGAVHDLETRFPDVALDADNPFGFEVDTTEIVFRGRCRDCAGTERPTHHHRSINPPTSNEEQHPHG